VLDDLLSSTHNRLVCLGNVVQGGAQPAEVSAVSRGFPDAEQL
jgi:hypothetical protein